MGREGLEDVLVDTLLERDIGLFVRSSVRASSCGGCIKGNERLIHAPHCPAVVYHRHWTILHLGI